MNAFLNRRRFLKLGAFAFPALSHLCGFERTPYRLVLLQLTGGNDGLSTIVPWADDAYHRARRTLAVDAKRVLKIDDYRGFHPGLQKLNELYRSGDMAIVEGAGYAAPIRSHFRSMDVWHTARRVGRSTGEGWVSRLCSEACADDTSTELVVHVGQRIPYSLHSVRRPPVAFATPTTYRWAADDRSREQYEKLSEENGEPATSGRDAVLARLRGVMRDAHLSSARIRRAAAEYEPKVDYPAGVFGDRLRTVAALIDSPLETRVFSLELEGFDTHVDQSRRYERLMVQLDRGVGAFFDDLAKHGVDQNVVVLAFSEFGRRVKENGGKGTDHGTAGPMFVIGRRVAGGVHGEHPKLSDLDAGDMKFTTDFRSVYGAVIDECFGIPHQDVLGARYADLALFESS